MELTATTTIRKPVPEVYAFWRDLENLPRFMIHLRSVRMIDQRRSHWIAEGPSGKIVEWDAEIVTDQPNQVISWRSLDGADVDTTGSVHFKELPHGRGTEVRVSLSRRGDLEKILVTTPSGVVELDDEAIRAFRSAGPFPNPPDGLIQKDNLITFAFSFYFEIGQPHISWRMPTSM